VCFPTLNFEQTEPRRRLQSFSRKRDEAHAPFAGVKNSGFGHDSGLFSTEQMTELKWIKIQSG
jgi:acyl-CoA reductase-like NAD-dependent aldehyde dehydrogenase